MTLVDVLTRVYNLYMTKFSEIYGRFDPKPISQNTVLDFEGITTHELECLVRFYKNSRKELSEQDNLKLSQIKEELVRRSS